LRGLLYWTTLWAVKSLVLTFVLLGFAGTALAVDRAELDSRIGALTVKFQALQSKPDKRIPAQTLRKAQAIILLDRTKAGFLFAFQGGSGLAMTRDPRSGAWSAPAFFTATEASVGFQIGGQQSFVVVLLMSTNAARGLTDSTFDFSGEASGTAGNATGGTGVSSNDQPPLVFSDSEGLYGGVAVKGGNISPDPEADVAYYGRSITVEEILFEHKAKPSEAAARLAQVLNQAAK
jgi:lipid-binding SYLF domain-containing protein